MCPTNQSLKVSSSATSGAHSRELLEELSTSPAFPDLDQTPPPLLLCGRPRIVRGLQAPDPGLDEHEAWRALGVRGGEEKGQPAPLLSAPEDGTLGARSIHDRSHIVHPRLERRYFPHAVRKSRAALVQHEHARKRRKSLDVPDEQRLFPGRQEVARVRANEDEVDGAVPDDLVSDRDVAASSVVNVRNLHG
jgi:hypothetical protein